MHHFKVSEVWELLTINIIGPLPTTLRGNMFILAATDLFTKWVEAFPLKTRDAQEVVQSLLNIFLNHGYPKRILSDQGQEFVDQVNNELLKLLVMKNSVMAVYHAQANSLDKTTNESVKSDLGKCVAEHPDDWDDYVASAVFSIVSKPNRTTKLSPFYLMYRRDTQFPTEQPQPEVYENGKIRGKNEKLKVKVKDSHAGETGKLASPEEDFGKALINNQRFLMESEHTYSCVSEAVWDNGSNGTASDAETSERKRYCSGNDSNDNVYSLVTDRSGDQETSKPLRKLTRGNFVSIKPNQCVFQSENWKPNGSTLYHPVTSLLLVNIDKYDQLSFDEGSYFIGDASGGCLQKESGHTIHCWRYDEKDKKLFVSLSFLFTNPSIFQEIARTLGAV